LAKKKEDLFLCVQEHRLGLEEKGILTQEEYERRIMQKVKIK